MTMRPVIPQNISMSLSNIEPTGRIDAIRGLSAETWIAGGRESLGNTVTRGKIYRTTNGAVSWSHVSTLPGTPDINAIEAMANGNVLALTGAGVLYKSLNNGDTWPSNVTVSTSSTTFAIRTYGLQVLDSGTVLVCDTRTGGGRLFRSTDGATTFDAGQILGTAELYRIMKTSTGAVVNGWEGKVWRTVNDGVSWTSVTLTTGFPYGMFYQDSILLVGDSLGNVYRSTNDGQTFATTGKLGGEVDDISGLGSGVFICSVYTGARELFMSDNNGLSWWSVGNITNADTDWIDRMSPGIISGKPAVVGGSLYGRSVTLKM